MFTIEFILPYSNIAHAVEEAFKEHPQRNNMTCSMSFIAHDEVKTSELKGDIIIARGLTATFLNKMLKGTFTVVEIPMTGYDILEAINKAKALYNDDNIALIATESAIYGFEQRVQTIVPHVQTYEVSYDSDVTGVIKKAISDGARVIIGGNEVITITESLGYRGVRIETGKQGIRQAIDEAWNIHMSKLEEELQISRLNAVLENIGEGVIACNKNMEVTVCNAYAQSLLGKTKAEIIGKMLSDVHPELNRVEFNTITKKEISSPVNINGILVAITRIPVFVNSEFGSGTIVLQKLSNIQKMEVENSINANSKGLVALHHFSDILGESSALARTKKLALNYSRVQANVLLLGETGTGKELFAQSIHNASDRKSASFVAVNCAALPESLLESELFGYSDGAFTGALKGGKQGLFELANKGTIFLDEISEMSVSLQGRLLRVLEERSIRRIGHDKVIPVDVRIIAASNQNLEKLVEEGKFRRDLFYRLDVLRLVIPPLRERKEDIPVLVSYFMTHFDLKNRMCRHMIDPEIFPVLQAKSWPGNVRQLRNYCERLSAVVSDSLITVDSILSNIPEERTCDTENAESEEERIRSALRKFAGNKSAAASFLKIDRSTLYRKMKHYGVV